MPAPGYTRLVPVRRWLIPLLTLCFALLTLASLARVILLVGTIYDGVDFHAYWYAGNFLRAGINPYLAYAEGLQLTEPVRFLDGPRVAPEAVAQAALSKIPANTAPLLLLLAPWSFFSWPVARGAWLLVNLAVILAIPWLALRLPPPGLLLTRGEKWLLVSFFYAMKGARGILSTGQTSGLVFLFMLLALLWRAHWLPAGLLFGLALSKYSLAAPLFIYFLLERRFRLLAVALVVQIAGTAVLAQVDGRPLADTVGVYLQLFSKHAGEAAGVHWAMLLPAQGPVAPVILAGASLIVLAGVGWWCHKTGWRLGSVDLLPVVTVLTLWTLLVAYHRNYDTFLAIFFYLWALGILTTRILTPRQALALTALALAVAATLVLPGEIFKPFVGEARGNLILVWVDRALTVGLTALLAASLWLMRVTEPHAHRGGLNRAVSSP